MFRTFSLVALGFVLGLLVLTAVRPTSQETPMPRETPLPEHEYVQAGVGEWVGTMTSFMTADGTPIPATQSVVAIGPFWTQSTFRCEFMGEPYTGTGALGYDPERKKFIGTWIDSYTSYMALMEGERNADGVLVMQWMAPDPMGSGMILHRYEYEQKKDSEVTNFFMGEGEGVQTMQISLRRK